MLRVTLVYQQPGDDEDEEFLRASIDMMDMQAVEEFFDIGYADPLSIKLEKI